MNEFYLKLHDYKSKFESWLLGLSPERKALFSAFLLFIVVKIIF